MGFCFSMGKSEREEILSSQYQINENAAMIGVIIGMLSSKPELVKRLETVRERVKYLSPTKDKRVQELDKKMGDFLCDLKASVQTAKIKDKWDGVTASVNELVESVIPTRIAKSGHRTV